MSPGCHLDPHLRDKSQLCYENDSLAYNHGLPDITASHPNNLPRCVDNQEYNKYLKYADTSHQHLLGQDGSSQNVGLDSNQNYSEHLQPYFAYNYPPHMVDSQHSPFLPYGKSEYMGPPSQSMEYGHDSYMLHGDLHRYQQSSPSAEHMIPNASIAPMASPSPPPLLAQTATQGKTDEEFSGILADVRKTCFSS